MKTSKKSREGYDFERNLADPYPWKFFNFSSYVLLCLIVAGRDAMGMDIGYDETGLKDAPTPYERELAAQLLQRALKEVRDWPELALVDPVTGEGSSSGGEKLKTIAREVLAEYQKSPAWTASAQQLEGWRSQL